MSEFLSDFVNLVQPHEHRYKRKIPYEYFWTCKCKRTIIFFPYLDPMKPQIPEEMDEKILQQRIALETPIDITYHGKTSSEVMNDMINRFNDNYKAQHLYIEIKKIENEVNLMRKHISKILEDSFFARIQEDISIDTKKWSVFGREEL